MTALALLVPAPLFARTQYVCHMIERVVTSRCCAGEHRSHDITPAPSVRSRDCCERIPAQAKSPVLGTFEQPQDLGAPACVGVPPETPYVVPIAAAAEVPRQVARAPPTPSGPPLFIAHCALLI